MKPLSFSLVLGSGILLGGVGGWALRGTGQASTQSASRMPDAAEVPSPTKSNRQAPAPSSPRVQQEMQKLVEKPNEYPITKFTEWDVAELRALAKDLMVHADPVAGMSHQQKYMLRQILVAMANKDMEGTLAWVDATFPNQRYHHYQFVVDSVMQEASAKEKLEFMKARGIEPKDIGTYASTLMFASANGKPLDTETAVYLLQNFSPYDGSGFGSNSGFAPGFDFARFAEATAEKIKADGGKKPAAYPSNFLEEWAKVAPQQAIDFFFKNCTGKNAIELPFNHLDSILDVVKSSVPTEEYSSWLGQTIQQQYQGGSPDLSMINGMVLQELGDPSVLGPALNVVQDPATKAQLLRDALATAAELSIHSGEMGRLRGALTLYPDPTERLTGAEGLMHTLKQRNGDRDVTKMIDNLTQQLANLGHSEAEIEKVRNTK